MFHWAEKRTEWFAETDMGREEGSREVRSLCSWREGIYPEVDEG